MKSMPITILKDIENDCDLVVGRKYNGFNETLTVKHGKIKLFNRSGTEHTDNVPHITNIEVSNNMDLVLHGEGIAPSDRVEDAKSIFGSGTEHSIDWQIKNGRARFIAVNITRYKGEELSHIPFGERISTLREAVLLLQMAGVQGIKAELLNSVGKEETFRNVVLSGGEGIVVKMLSGYEKDWFKVKKVKTWDAIILGFTKGNGKYSGVIGAICYGFYNYNGNLQEAGRCSGMTDAERFMFASAPEAYIGRVIEIRGQEVGNRGGIVFPRFVRIRDDKLPSDCLLPY